MENPQSRMRLRSSVPPEEKEKNAQINQKIYKETLPFIQFHGLIEYQTDFIGCATSCEALIKMVEESEDLLVMGFDMEWPFSFKTGPGKTSLIQISPNLDITYLLHVSEMKKLPLGLCTLLSHSKIRLTGNNIKNDVRKLARDFQVIDVEKIIGNCIDCGVFANEVLPVTQRWSLEKLVESLLKMRINKDKKIRMSKWAIIPLNKEQKLYAATDTYASLKVYLQLKIIQEDPSTTENLPIIIG